MRKVVLGAALAGVLVVVGAGAAWGQVCGPSWAPGFETDGTDSDPFAIVAFDPDGPGPRRAGMVFAGQFEGAGGVFARGVAFWNGERWEAMGQGVNFGPSAAAVFDGDGDGPNPARLFVGGLFTQVDGQAIRGVARWDGVSWSQVGNWASTGGNEMQVWDDDGAGPNPPALYVGGSFTVAGGALANRLAKWDGSAWSQVGASGLPATVSALAVHDFDGAGPGLPELVAAGSFRTSAGAAGERIVRWNGTAFAPIGTGFSATTASISALGSFDPDGVGPGLPRLYAGGDFSQVTPFLSASNLAQFNGTAWSAVGTGASASVRVLRAFDLDGAGPEPEKLVIAGSFSTVGGVAAPSVALYDGAAYSAFPGGRIGSVASAGAADLDGDGLPELYVGGYIIGTGPDDARTRGQNAVVWEGGAWRALGSGNGIDLIPTAFEVFDDDGPGPRPPAVYVGGTFARAGDESVNSIARWNGWGWEDVGGGVTEGTASVLMVWDEDGAGPGRPALFAGGTFALAGGVPHDSIARWDGQAWSSLDGGLNGAVRGMVVWDPDGPGVQREGLYVVGRFTTAGGPVEMGGIAANGVARWDGFSWSAVGNNTSFSNGITAVVVHDPDGAGPGLSQLVVAGSWTSPANRVARLSGTSWVGLGTGLPPCTSSCTAVRTLTSFDEDGSGPGLPRLYAGGDFAVAGGVTGLARWDGVAWTVPGGSLSIGNVYDLTVFDDDGPGVGAEPALYIGCRSPMINGATFNHLARWDGVSMTPVGGGVLGLNGVAGLEALDEDGAGPGPAGLWVGGYFRVAGEVGSGNIARWGRSFPAAVVDQPDDRQGVAGGSVTFEVGVSGTSPLVLQWRKDGVGLVEGGRVSGSRTPRVEIRGLVTGDAGRYDAVVTNACGSVTSGAAVLTLAGAGCAVDFTGDGLSDVRDIFAFLSLWFERDAEADFNGAGGVDVIDIFAFLAAWFVGC